MASIIRIKRSTVSGNPTTLAAGELAYSGLTDNGSNGGDRLYIGLGTETAGNAANHIVIGGKYFTDKLDHTPGVLTATSALIVDADSKLDNLKVDNLDLNGNTLSSTDINGNILITPNGTGKTVISNLYIGDTSTSLTEFIQDVTGGGLTAGSGIDISYDDTAGTSTISLNTEAVQDIIGGMVSTNTESGISVTYDDTNGKLDFNVNDPVITITGDVDGSATMTNLGDTTINVTLDTVNSNVGTFGSTTSIPVLTVNGKGLVTAASTVSVATTLGLAADTGTDSISLLTDTLNIIGGEGIDTSINAATNTLTIAAEDASSSNKGVATFNTSGFVVTSGDVVLKGNVAQSVNGDSGSATPASNAFTIAGTSAQGITTSATGSTVTITATDASTTQKGVASFNTNNFTVSSGAVSTKDITLGSTTLTNGSTTAALAGLTQLDVDNIRIDGNTISSTNANGNIVLDPNGTGVIDASATRITNLAEPVADSDAATKYYVDAARSGLDVKESVRAATTTNITLSNTQTIDGVALSVGDRVLVKDQTTASQNGIYIVAAGAWSRSADADQPNELDPGTFVFVEEGTVNADCGFVVSSDNPLTIGTDPILWTLFSASGSIIAGNGLSKSGYTLEVNVAANGGIEIASDSLQLKSTLAGNGLTYSSGVLAVGGTADRITVGADSIDIAATYVGQTSITTLGTITTGTWQGTIVSPTYGGTGVNNGSKTITLGGNLTTSGAFNTTLTATANTNVTLPTTGTLATLAGTETLTNKTLTTPTINGGALSGTFSGAHTYSGAVTISDNTVSTTTSTGALIVAGGVGVQGQATINNAKITAATASTSTTSGALIVAGGFGVGGAVFMGSNLTGAGASTSAIDGFNIDGGTY